jgi:hypothetical protein
LCRQLSWKGPLPTVLLLAEHRPKRFTGDDGKAMICKRMQTPMAMTLTWYPRFSATFPQFVSGKLTAASQTGCCKPSKHKQTIRIITYVYVNSSDFGEGWVKSV